MRAKKIRMENPWIVKCLFGILNAKVRVRGHNFLRISVNIGEIITNVLDRIETVGYTPPPYV
jgi:hypothetical protein